MTTDTTPHTAAPLLCGDGGILTIHIDEHGAAVSKALSPAFFDPDDAPIQEDGESSRRGETDLQHI